MALAMQIKRRKEIPSLKQSLLFCPTRQGDLVYLMLISSQTAFYQTTWPNVTAYHWLGQNQSADVRGVVD